jgi:hypothetical protein
VRLFTGINLVCPALHINCLFQLYISVRGNSPWVGSDFELTRTMKSIKIRVLSTLGRFILVSVSSWGVAKLVKAPDFDSGIRRFDSFLPSQ